MSIEDLGDEEVALLPPSFPAALYDALMPPFTPAGRVIRRTRPCRTLHEVISEVSRGRLVHPTVASLPLVARGDIALVPILDMEPLPLGPIWCKAHENGRIRALVEAAQTIPLGVSGPASER